MSETTPAPELALEAEEFLVWLAANRGRAPATIQAYRRDLMGFTTWLFTERGTALGEASTEDLAAWVNAQRAQGAAAASVARRSVAVRSLFAFLAAEGSTTTDPSTLVEPVRVPAGLPKALEEAEVARLLAAPTGDEPVARRDRAMLEVLYGTGLRISELVGLSLSDLDLSARLVRVFGKGAKERVVPVGRFASDALEAWLAPGGREILVRSRTGRPRARDDDVAVFVNQRGGRLTRQGAWLILRSHARQVGLADRVTPHVLRHSCATHMVDHGADVRAVQELLGHASITTTQIYTKVSTARLRAVYDDAHPRARHPRQRNASGV